MWTLAERLTRLAVDQDFTSSILVRPPFKNVIQQNYRRNTMAGASKNARRTFTTHKFFCLCGGEISMKTVFDNGRLKNLAECSKCKRTERRPKDFN